MNGMRLHIVPEHHLRDIVNDNSGKTTALANMNLF